MGQGVTSGHSIERCFKVHGYPNSSKPGKRLATTFHSHVDNDGLALEHTSLATLQFNNLLSLLGKHKNSTPDDCPSDSPSLTNTPYLVGISCLISKRDSSVWIILIAVLQTSCAILYHLSLMSNPLLTIVII